MLRVSVYANGKSVEQGYSKAVEWYRRASDKEDVVAQNNLEWLYSYCQGIR